ncbi:MULTISPECIES: O-acetyl-ADP-ribose deacetylase [Dehalobacter]|uniref:O-acetyl-ADP-ribose deacetylase n=1 Tax=Dehalobacter restrictus TaxID=55583 RepID=A0A857DID6_9FIRM|nr:O-acetyl-ADP-ribose deacetylase [Dehalobacter restrictus]QHA01054.1 O-acetyl-ADP-ribose deacetylase [Dehalobacter restrictus]UWG95952.1 O-acetyl-ADP-ribose deacetylase [Dehalobacter sp. DCM]
MPLEIIRNDITKVHADAIVNAANTSLLGGGGVDGAIHRAAGSELLVECRALGGCKIGQAKITKGYNLPAKYVIHTVGPIWHDGKSDEEKLLADSYRNSLALAKDYKLESIAFPLISSGAFGYPKDKALKIAISVIGDFLLSNEMTVFLVVYDKAAFALSEKLFTSIAQYIDDKYIEERPVDRSNRFEERHLLKKYYIEEPLLSPMEAPLKKRKRSLDDVVKHMDETFSQMLLRLIDEKGMTDAETYKKANIDRKLFSKIRNDINYKPSKPTAIAFAIAMRLNPDETKDLLLKAGFALSNSSKFDIIIQYFIDEGNYNVFEINEALFAFDQNLLGG